MNKKIIALLVLLASGSLSNAANVGLLVVATGRYIEFVDRLLDGADQYFCKGHNVTYFVFTDREIAPRPNLKVITQRRAGWPHDSLLRCRYYADHAKDFEGIDYLYACDADMIMLAPVGNEIFGERVATLHHAYLGTKGTYERSARSRACIYPHEGKAYYAGGFYGGSTKEFIKMSRTMIERIQEDLSHGIIAVWHDESHLNRYFIDNPPTIELSPSYCYHQGSESKYPIFPQKIVAIGKDNAAYRQ